MTTSLNTTGRIYCSDAARLRGDDNSATASRVDAWILVELPVTWGREPIDDAPMPDTVRRALKAACTSIPFCRIVFIRKRVESRERTRVLVARSTAPAGIAQIELPSIETIASLSFADLLENVRPDAPPVILVCTHGQHDSCCGRRGYPLFEALQQRSDIDVWQCSHIGGDRFAANAVVLPWGLYYGPVEARDASVLADTALGNEVLINAFRGRSTLPRILQAAEIHVRRMTGITERDALQLAAREREGDIETITLCDRDGTRYVMTIERYISTEAARLTCLASAPSPVPQFRVVGYRTSAR